MSGLHRNALLDDEAMCLKCGATVVLPADYCPRCVFMVEVERIVMGNHHAAYCRGFGDREIGLPRNCQWYDKPSRDAYRIGYNAAKAAQVRT